MSDNDFIQSAQEIARLLFKELHDELTPLERQQLNSWKFSQDKDTQEYIERITEWRSIDKDLQLFDSFNPAAALADVNQTIKREVELQGRPIYKVPKRSNRAFFVSAVIIIIGAGAGITQYLLGGIKESNVALAAETLQINKDIVPGTNKAMLTLTDGRQIALDNATNGELAKEEKVSIIKKQDGELIYKALGMGKAADRQTGLNTITTPRGGQFQVVLPDGSKVWLNASSSIRFPTMFSGKERRVEISGEAFIQVSKDVSVPFKASIAPSPSSGGEGAEAFLRKPIDVEVLGTSFNIQAYADNRDIRTTLVNGSVKIHYGDEQVLLKPGDQAQVDHTSSQLKLLNHVNMDEVIGWKCGDFCFQGSSLEEVMNELSRWYDVKIEYKGARPTETLTANLSRSNSLENILKVLEISGYRFEIQGKVIVVSN